MDTVSLSRTAFEIFDFKLFRGLTLTFDLWESSGVKHFYVIRKLIYDFLFDFYGQHLSISYRFEIFDFKVFKVWPWPLISKGHLGSKHSYYSKAQIWLPIWLLWTPSLYLVYLTAKFLGFDLDLWPLKVIWGQQMSYHSKAHIWLPIWLLWTPSLYLVPFSRSCRSKFWRPKKMADLLKVKVKNRFFP